MKHAAVRHRNSALALYRQCTASAPPVHQSQRITARAARHTTATSRSKRWRWLPAHKKN